MSITQLIHESDRKRLLLNVTLCIFILLIYFIPTDTVKQTGKFVAGLELLFCILYSQQFRPKLTSLLPPFRSHQAIYVIAILAGLSILCSYGLFVSTNFDAPALIRFSSYQFLFLSIHTIFAIFLCSFLLKNPPQLSSFVAFTPVVAGNLALVFFLYVYFFRPEITPTEWFRSPPLGAHIRNTGWLINISSITSICFLLYTQVSTKRFIIYATLSLAAISFLFWTGGRAAIVSFFLCTIIVAAVSFANKKLKLYKLLCLAALIIFAAVIANNCALSENNGLIHIQKTPSLIAADQTLESLTTGRSYMWQKSFEQITQAPFLGHGPNAYIRVTDNLYGSQPHNFIIQFLLDWGVFGTILLLSILLVFLVTSLKVLTYKQLRVETLCHISIFILLASNAFLSGTLYHSQALFFFSASLAGLIAARNNMLTVTAKP